MRENKDEKYMRAALGEARKAAESDEIPVGAVIVLDDIIIARAHNLTETLKDATAHAEMQAITAAAGWIGGKYLTGCTMYVTVEPCAMCAGAIGWSQLTRLVYGAPDEKKGFTRMSGQFLHPATRVTGGLLENECGSIITAFLKSKRRPR